MRIIAGELKGRKLNTPIGDEIRPTTDKVKEALFSSIQFELPDSIVLDLYAGTGSLGLEALSRGAKKCYFSDNDRKSIELIRQNIELCNMTERSIVLRGDATENLSRIKEGIDMIFMDPPYFEADYLRAIERIIELDLLNEFGRISCEHSSSIALPDDFQGLNKIREKKYGRIMLTMYEKE